MSAFRTTIYLKAEIPSLGDLIKVKEDVREANQRFDNAKQRGYASAGFTGSQDVTVFVAVDLIAAITGHPLG